MQSPTPAATGVGEASAPPSTLPTGCPPSTLPTGCPPSTLPKGYPGHEAELRTAEQLLAAGFPPELARRAASAYPTNVERAADWILASEEW